MSNNKTIPTEGVSHTGGSFLKTPFIKKFRTDRYNYIYDVNSNEILRVDRIVYDMVDSVGTHDIDAIIDKFKDTYQPEDIVKSHENIKKARQKNYFSDHRPEISSGIESENDVKTLLESGIRQIVLNVTTRCNLNCRYCTFSGNYSVNKGRKKDDMSFKTAKKAIDFFIKNSPGTQNETPAAVTFYGGEPLLTFGLIKEVVELMKGLKLADKYNFSLTTNGTLLTKDVIEYFVKNNISILISLDGPKEINDRYRVFNNGKGTFDRVIKNISQIRKYSREYFSNKVSFNSIICPPYQFDSVIDFFYRKELFAPLNEKIRIDFVDSYDTTFFEDFHLEDEWKGVGNELNNFIIRFKKALINGEYEKLTVEKHFFSEAFYNIACRNKETMGKKYPPLGTCVPGKRRLFVSTGGTFFMCEKVNENHEIGNVDEGFNLKRIYDFYKKYDEFFKDCKYCWALRLCKKCFNDIRRGADFDQQRKETMCKNILRNLEKNLIVFCEIIEKNPTAFKIFKDVRIK